MMHKRVIIFKYSACFSNNIVWCITYINTETLAVTPPTQLQAAGTIQSGYYFLHFSLEVRVKNESGLYLSAGTKRAHTVNKRVVEGFENEPVQKDKSKQVK